ncbi:unnamed protein product [Callosobruchus maculatus]|uniref:Peptidase S1 domain-containing protein n=1 Tax=Callosobruchus maculatus TaxID=64391 RepID=A0A653C334_CALMS|nr:unnamed protein product [Callosobruchus maculatus]
MYKLVSAITFTFFFMKCSVLYKIEERVIGGEACTGFDHHFAVVLRTKDNRTMCTGSLLSADWVLTAAHCCHFELGFVMAGVSTNNVSGPLDNNTKVVAIEECIMHKYYEPYQTLNDIAVLRLSEPIVCVYKKGTGVSHGDSGGPFMCNDAQYGITSYGAATNPTEVPSVSTRVDSYLGFIKDKTGVGNSAKKAIVDHLLSFQIVVFVTFWCNQHFVIAEDLSTTVRQFVTSQKSYTTQERVICGNSTCDGVKHDFVVLITGLLTMQKCGGTLLNSKWVLTAGQCCDKELKYVFAGLSTSIFPLLENKFSFLFVLMNENVKGRVIERCILYEHYDPVNSRNNLALVKLSREIAENPAVSYVKLPSAKMEGDFHKLCPQATTMGWGITNPMMLRTTNLSSLQCVTHKMDPPDKCISAFHMKNDPKTILCSHASPRRFLDDGGPLVCNNIQYGIITDLNGTYTRVDNYLDFIESNSRGLCISNSINLFVILFVHIVIHMLG